MCERPVMQATYHNFSLSFVPFCLPLVACCSEKQIAIVWFSTSVQSQKVKGPSETISQQPVCPVRLNNHWAMCFYVMFNYKQILSLLYLIPRNTGVCYYPILYILHWLVDASLNLVWSSQDILPRIIQRHCKTVFKITSTTITFTYY